MLDRRLADDRAGVGAGVDDPAPGAQQVRPGYDLDVRTPVPNLVEVGDGVKPYGWIGTTACAQTARTAVDALVGELSPRLRTAS